MLDNLRDLFLAALKCDDEIKAKILIQKWNQEVENIQRILDNLTDKVK